MTNATNSKELKDVETRYSEVIVIGAGFSGLYALHKLRDGLDLDVQLLEKGDGLGGTWYWNRYPGARCDSESYYYSYSFSPEIEQKWSWTERYPDHREIRKYLEFVADHLDLKKDIHLSTMVTSAHFEETSSEWVVSTNANIIFRARYLVTGVGCLSSANVPNIPGLDRFGGEWYHTGHWPHEGVNLKGKRIGQIGTGSTGIQLAPEIAKEAAHLTIFQRTANYSVPARNAPLTEEFQHEVKKNYAEIRALARRVTNGHPFEVRDKSALEVSDAEREAFYEDAWQRGGIRFRAVFRDILNNHEANETVSNFIRHKISGIVKDPKVAEKLIPTDHGFATKRPPVDTNYFETFNRNNVSLIDLKAEPIEEITETGIRTTAQNYDLDMIVFATGFDAFTGPLTALNICGSKGQSLKESWQEGPKTYLGVQVPGFPNMFTITGPGSPSVLCNMPVAIEQHVEWISGIIGHMRSEGLTRIEAKNDAADEWMDQVRCASEATLLSEASSSWYLGANVPGKPKVFIPYAGGMNRYADICDNIAHSGYPGFDFN